MTDRYRHIINHSEVDAWPYGGDPNAPRPDWMGTVTQMGNLIGLSHGQYVMAGSWVVRRSDGLLLVYSHGLFTRVYTPAD
jgi:hypothetical protein